MGAATAYKTAPAATAITLGSIIELVKDVDSFYACNRYILFNRNTLWIAGQGRYIRLEGAHNGTPQTGGVDRDGLLNK